MESKTRKIRRTGPIKSFADADARLGKRSSVRVANNTVMHRIDNETIGVKLHATDVVTYHANGLTTLETGGWTTVTTRDRIRTFSHAYVWQTNSGRHRNEGDMWIMGRDGKRMPFEDGVQVCPDGFPLPQDAGEPDWRPTHAIPEDFYAR